MKRLKSIIKNVFPVSKDERSGGTVYPSFEFEDKEELGIFDILPDEILLEVFKFLSVEDVCRNIALSCLRFARLHRLGVHTIRVTGNLRKLPEDRLIKILHRFEKLEKLIICNNGSLEDYQITNSGLIQLAHKYIYHTSDYQSYNNRFDCNFKDFGYEKMLDELSNIDSNSIFSGDPKELDNTDAISDIDDIFYKAYSETASTISGDSGKSLESSKTIKSLFSEFQNYRPFFEKEQGENSDAKEEPVYGLNTLRYLDLTGCCLLTDFGVKYLTFLCREIEHLYLRGCDKLTDNAVSYFSEFKNLKSLDLSGMTRLTDKSMEQLSLTQKKLQILDATFCRKITNKGLSYLSNISSLTEVKFQCCIELSEEGLIHLFNKCKSLKKVDLTGCSHVKLSRIPLELDIELKDLEALSLLGCIQTTNHCLDLIVRRIKCKKLKKFRAAYCDKITDKGIRKIVKFCSKLENLSVKKCSKLTHQSIKYISKFCKNLKKFNCTGIEFNTISFYYLRSMKELENLIIQSCKTLSNNQLNHISGIPKLKSLDLSFNDNISYSGVKELCYDYYPRNKKKQNFELGNNERLAYLEKMCLIRCPLSHRQKKELEKNFPKISFRFNMK